MVQNYDGKHFFLIEDFLQERFDKKEPLNNPSGLDQSPKDNGDKHYESPVGDLILFNDLMKSGIYKRENAQTKRIVLQRVKGIKARVNKIHVDGLMRTKDDIIKPQVMDLFKAKSLHDVYTRAENITKKLDALECFKEVEFSVDINQGPEAIPDGVDVTFEVREMNRLDGSISTIPGNNEGSLNIGVKASNLFGRAERVQMYGNKSLSNFNISAIKPFPKSLYNAVLTGTVFSTTHDFPRSGFKQNDKGLLFDMKLNKTDTSKHNIQYEAAFRNITSKQTEDLFFWEQCGPSLKSALRYIWTIDKRDSAIFPVTGNFLRLTTEMAGFGGDIGFIKNKLDVQSNWSPHELLTFQLGLQSGLLSAIGNDKKISIADHFFLGDPLNVRGFDMRGCGPRYNGNSVGSEMYWAAALHVYTPLPFYRLGRNDFGDSFRLHGFINGGNLSNITNGDIYNGNMKIFTENVRCAIGGGIVVKLGNARIELNLIAPLLFIGSDVLQQFQFGIGVEYL